MAAPDDPHAKLSPSDIETSARYVEGVDPQRYFDSQMLEVQQAARKRWPLLTAAFYPDEADAPNEADVPKR